MALIGVIRTKFVVNFLHDFKLLENNLRILIRKKHRQIQIQLFQKVRLWTFGWLVTGKKTKKKKKKSSSWQNSFLFDMFILYSPFYLS